MGQAAKVEGMDRGLFGLGLFNFMKVAAENMKQSVLSVF